jgi:cation/acetate symporter
VVEAGHQLGGRVEPDPVVVHLQHHRVGGLDQLDPGAGGPCVGAPGLSPRIYAYSASSPGTSFTARFWCSCARRRALRSKEATWRTTTVVIWAIGIIGSFYILTTFLGFGAAALVGQERIKEADAAGNMAGPLLAQTIGGGEGSFGGDLFLAFISAVAFATILAVVAGLTITASSSFAHDFYANVMRRGRERDEAAEVRVARITALVIGAIAIVLASFARGQNVAFLVGLAFAVAASANLPTILFSLYWKRFTTSGAVTGILVGLFGSLLLVVIGPNVMGPKGLIFTGSEPLFPLENPGIVSIPLGFAAAWLGTMLSREPASEEMYEELRVRALTGLGAEEAEAAPTRSPATRSTS